MNDSPSKYGGLAVVFLLGIGLLIVGFNLTAERHAQAVSMGWIGAFILAFGLLAMMIQAGWISGTLAVSVAATICSGALILSAARSEITGTAVYHHHFLMRRGWRTEPVTRQEKPDMFQEATNVRWALSIVCAALGIGSFPIYRKTEYLED